MAAIYKNKLYIWGGCIKPMSKKDNNLWKDIYIFDHKSNKWTKQTIESGSPSSYYCCAYANANELVYIFGGRGNKNKHRFNMLCCLDLENMTWSEMENTGDTPGSKSGAGMIIWNGQLILFGGYGYRRKNPPFEDDNTSFIEDFEYKIGLGWTNDLHFYDLSKGEY